MRHLLFARLAVPALVAPLAALALLTGCATSSAPPPLRPGEIPSALSALAAITPGKSTKADVRAALGEAVVIDFDSGYEVWVYRERLKEKASPPRTEFVVLFAPSGVATKTRVR